MESDEIAFADAQRRARLAQEILDNEVWQSAFKDLRNALVDKWEATSNSTDRDELWRYYKLCDKLQQVFLSAIKDGENAAFSLKQLQERKSFVAEMYERMRK